MKTRLVIIAIALLFLSCENPFSPKGPYSPRLVVYSVLTNTRSYQFVRVSSTYNPPGANTDVPDSGFGGAAVRIIADTSTFTFRDTLLEGVSGQPIHGYVCDSLPVAHGAQYRLEVLSDSLGLVRSSITVPTAPSVLVPGTTAQLLDFVLGGTLRFSAGLSGGTRSYLIRMYIEFETYQGPDTVRQRWEVPLFVTDTSFADALYPSFQYTDRPSFDFTYSGSAYITTLAKIVYRYSILVKFRNIVFEVYQIGEPLQTYSSIVNGFNDELSIRTDQPDYSNITGGLGLFGAYTRDEVLRPFPQNFYYNPAPAH